MNLNFAFLGSFLGINYWLAVSIFLNVGQMFYPPARNLPPVSVKGCAGFNSSVSSGIIYPKDPVYK